MKEVQFQLGEVVRLKSGGPDMVIEGITREGEGTVYGCVWFSANDEGPPLRHIFAEVCLVKS